MNYIVYIHKTPNNKYYVGITKQSVENRWKNSLGYRTQTVFYRAIQKYGWGNIEHIIVATNLTHDEACAMEVDLIAKYKSNNPKYGYNRTSGGDGTCNFSHKNPHSDEWRKKVSIANTGGKRTLEQRKRMSESAKGRHHTEQTKKQISETCKKVNTAQYFNTPEVREKILRKSRVPIYLLDDEGNIIKAFKSMTDCAKYLNISVSLVSLIINGKHQESVYAHKIIKGEWKYE